MLKMWNNQKEIYIDNTISMMWNHTKFKKKVKYTKVHIIGLEFNHSQKETLVSQMSIWRNKKTQIWSDHVSGLHLNRKI